MKRFDSWGDAIVALLQDMFLSLVLGFVAFVALYMLLQLLIVIGAFASYAELVVPISGATAATIWVGIYHVRRWLDQSRAEDETSDNSDY